MDKRGLISGEPTRCEAGRYFMIRNTSFFISLTSLLLLLVLNLILTKPLMAVGNIHFGALEVHPVFSLSEGYVDNLFLNSRDKETSSGYTVFKPGLKCDWIKRKYDVQLSYLYEIYEYTQEGVKDENFYDLDTKCSFNLGKSGRYIKFNGRYRLRRTTDPATSEEQAEDRKEKDLNFGLKINLMNRLSISFYPNFVWHRYDNPEEAMERDKDIRELSTKLNMRFFSRTDILLEYRYSRNKYLFLSKEKDSKTQSILTGLEWETTEKLQGAIKIGYQQKEYTGNSPNTTSKRFPDIWKVEVDLTHKLSEFTSLQLALERRIVDSTYNDVTHYYLNSIDFGLDHKFTYKISTWMDFIYSYADYYQDPRWDNGWQVDLGLVYTFTEWIRAHFTYHGKIRQSNKVYYYKSNQVNIGLNLVF